DRFRPKDIIDRDCLKVATEAYALYQQFPDETVFRNARPNGGTNGEDMEQSISMEKYVSFCADAKGWLMDSLVESVNSELQEYGQMEEPVIVKRFDGSEITAGTLEFENRLLRLIDELTYILYNF